MSYSYSTELSQSSVQADCHYVSLHPGDGTWDKEEYLGGDRGGSSPTDVIKLIVSGRARVGLRVNGGKKRVIVVVDHHAVLLTTRCFPIVQGPALSKYNKENKKLSTVVVVITDRTEYDVRCTYRLLSVIVLSDRCVSGLLCYCFSLSADISCVL